MFVLELIQVMLLSKDPLVEAFIAGLDDKSPEYVNLVESVVSSALRLVNVPIVQWNDMSVLKYFEASEIEYNKRRKFAFELAQQSKMAPEDAVFEYKAFAPETKLNKLASLAQFFKFLWRGGYVEAIKVDFSSLAKKMRDEIVDERPSMMDRYAIPFEKLSKFINSTKNFKISAMLWLQYTQFLNIKEIISLRWCDVDFFANQIVLYKDAARKIVKRKAPMTRLARDLLYDYLVEYRFRIPLTNIRKSLQAKDKTQMDKEERQVFAIFHERSNDVFKMPQCDLKSVKDEYVFTTRKKHARKQAYTSIRSIQASLDRMNDIAGKELGLEMRITSRVIAANGMMDKSAHLTLEELHAFSGLKVMDSTNAYNVKNVVDEIAASLNKKIKRISTLDVARASPSPAKSSPTAE